MQRSSKFVGLSELPDIVRSAHGNNSSTALCSAQGVAAIDGGAFGQVLVAERRESHLADSGLWPWCGWGGSLRLGRTGRDSVAAIRSWTWVCGTARWDRVAGRRPKRVSGRWVQPVNTQLGLWGPISVCARMTVGIAGSYGGVRRSTRRNRGVPV